MKNLLPIICLMAPLATVAMNNTTPTILEAMNSPEYRAYAANKIVEECDKMITASDECLQKYNTLATFEDFKNCVLPKWAAVTQKSREDQLAKMKSLLEARQNSANKATAKETPAVTTGEQKTPDQQVVTPKTTDNEKPQEQPSTVSKPAGDTAPKQS